MNQPASEYVVDKWMTAEDAAAFLKNASKRKQCWLHIEAIHETARGALVSGSVRVSLKAALDFVSCVYENESVHIRQLAGGFCVFIGLAK